MWTQQGIHFNTADLDVAYGLKLQKDESKNFLMCIQAYFLKTLLFADVSSEKENKRLV